MMSRKSLFMAFVSTMAIVALSPVCDAGHHRKARRGGNACVPVCTPVVSYSPCCCPSYPTMHYSSPMMSSNSGCCGSGMTHQSMYGSGGYHSYDSGSNNYYGQSGYSQSGYGQNSYSQPVIDPGYYGQNQGNQAMGVNAGGNFGNQGTGANANASGNLSGQGTGGNINASGSLNTQGTGNQLNASGNLNGQGVGGSLNTQGTTGNPNR